MPLHTAMVPTPLPVRPTQPRLRTALWALAIVGWWGGMVAIGAALMADHWIGVEPRAGVVGARFFATAHLSHEPRTWSMGHLMYAKCPCSRKIIERLVERGARKDVQEFVLLVDALPAAEDALRAAGFVVQRITALDLGALGVDAAPAFVVIDGNGAVRHIGGYTARKQGLDLADVATLQALQAGQWVEELPVFGCVTARELQKILDPLRIKYSQF